MVRERAMDSILTTLELNSAPMYLLNLLLRRTFRPPQAFIIDFTVPHTETKKHLHI